jgi:hypothetical protein
MIPSSFIGRMSAAYHKLGPLLLAVVVQTATTPAWGQAVPDRGTAPTTAVTFTLDFPNSDPSHYAITVDADGHATYDCTSKASGDADPEPYHSEFTMTPANRDRVFLWARQAGYFSGKIDSGNRKLAFTGEKTLTYQEGEKSSSASYNISNLEPVRQLTTLFQTMESTLDYGRQLTYSYRYQKLALDDELKRMEAQARNNDLSEIQSVAPILEEIAGDSSVMNLVRARARELIQMSGRSGPGR